MKTLLIVYFCLVGEPSCPGRGQNEAHFFSERTCDHAEKDIKNIRDWQLSPLLFERYEIEITGFTCEELYDDN